MYKVLADNTIVGVLDTPTYVRYQVRNNKFISCNADCAQGVISEDGNVVWQLSGSAVIPFGEYTTVNLVEISEEEYNVLKEALEAVKTEPELTVEQQLEQLTLNTVVASKIQEMSAACSDAIIAGFDIELSDGETYHFDMTLEDQINMMTLRDELSAGTQWIPYHCAGGLCKYYSATDIQAILTKSNAFKQYNIVYFNSLKNYIKSLTNIVSVSNIVYGCEIPEEYQSEVLQSYSETLSTLSEE